MMWMAGFRYVIASTLTVQVIMKHNSQEQNEKLKQRTVEFQKKQIEKYGIEKLVNKSKVEENKKCYF